MSVTARPITGALALVAVTGFAGPAPAQQSQAWKWCEGTEAEGVSLDRQISGCTSVIQSGKESKKDLAIALYNRAIAYQDKGQFDRAIQDYDQVIKLDPNHAGAIYNRGNAYKDKGQYDRALQDYDQAIKLNPNYALAFYGREAAYGDKGQNDRASQDYDQAIKLDPNYAGALYNRGIAKRKNGDTAGAEADIKAARAIDPNVGR